MMQQTDQALWIENTPPDELARQLFNFANVKAEPTPLYYQDGDTLRFRFHKYQKQAMRTRERFILLLGGTQSGKTSFGPIWLHREIALRGPGDYLAVAPTYPLMQKKMLPEFQRFFGETLGLGSYNKSDRIFVVSDAGEIALFGKAQETKTRVYFGHAQDPDSLESATAKAAWLDECGQSKFKLASFEAIMRRLSLFIGRVLMTTTPYNLGWLKQKFWDVWEAGEAKAHSLSVIRFPSTANPSFPEQEYERARRDLPRWKFDMFYRAIFTRPAGMIYDCFDDAVHKLAAFDVPDEWPSYGGADFGGVNTAALRVRRDPETGNYYVTDEYWAGGKTAAGHAVTLKKWRCGQWYGGAKSEGQWRLEFGKAGMPIKEPPVSDVEVGIDRVYGLIKANKLFIFDTCVHLLDEIASYAREIDEMGEPTERIADKNSYHLLDALRYVGGYLAGGSGFNVLAHGKTKGWNP